MNNVIRKLPFIQILTGLYVICIALYMVFNDSSTAESAEFWRNYYWTVNKGAMLMTLVFNYKKQKSKIDWLTINFLTIQTGIIIVYFLIGLPYFKEWMKMNDAVIYSFFIGGFVALCLLWYISLRRAKE
jgi:hypothetical protein